MIDPASLPYRMGGICGLVLSTVEDTGYTHFSSS